MAFSSSKTRANSPAIIQEDLVEPTGQDLLYRSVCADYSLRDAPPSNYRLTLALELLSDALSDFGGLADSTHALQQPLLRVVGNQRCRHRLVRI